MSALTLSIVKSGKTQIAANMAAYAKASEGAFADNTTRAIRADSAIWAAWCGDQGMPSLPATPELVAKFIDHMAERRAPASVRRYASSIAHLHRAAAVPNPCDSQAVKLALRRMHRAKGRAQHQAKGLVEGDFRRMLAAAGNSPIDRRNKALLALGRAGLMRRSELVGLLIEDLATFSDGTGTVTLRRSKTDQEGVGATIFLPGFVRRLVQTWLQTAAITDGPILRAVFKDGVAGGPLTGGNVTRIVGLMAKAAGIDATGLSGHSLRVGMCQDLISAGHELPAIQQAGRWKSPEMVAAYGRKLSARKSAVATFYAE